MSFYGRNGACLVSSFFIFSSLMSSGCGSSSSSASGASVKANLKLASNSKSYALAENPFVPYSLSRIFSLQNSDTSYATSAGGASATQLESLKYYIGEISICESLTTSGTAYSSPTNCFTVYTGPSNSTLFPAGGAGSNPDYASMVTYASSITDGFIDLMDSTSRDKITTGGSSGVASAVKAGSYKWGYISWAYPIKVKATVTAGATTLYTHPGTTTNRSGSSALTTASTLFTTASAEEAIVSLPNGGTWFKFQNPFVVTDADVTAKTEYQLDLTFNPDNLIRGFAYTGSGGSNTPSNLNYYDGTNDGTHNAINVPFIDLTPVPRKSTDLTIVETYTATTLSGTTDTFKIRLELYYNSSDSTKSIYGATLRVLPLSSTQWATDIQKISFVKTASDGTLSFNDYADNPIISGFTRQTTVGGTTTATLPCSGAYASTNFAPTGCASGSSVTTTFSLSSLNSLN